MQSLISLLLLLPFTTAVSAPKCTPPALAPITKCLGGSFNACASGLLPIPLSPPSVCHFRLHHLLGCITHCADSPRIALPTCPPYECLPTPKKCYDTCYAASSCVSTPPKAACECNNSIIASCSNRCGLPMPVLAPCPEDEETGKRCYERCRAARTCSVRPRREACECENRGIVECARRCRVPVPPVKLCPRGVGWDCGKVCKTVPNCPQAWPAQCWCELSHRKNCVKCWGGEWDEERESAACKGDII
ncbi:hypothetical protein EX30DRAFT_367433 [Ascodesmis nigricans]|uniref:Uncharacterized protein n=1 Tax=Ascodesmis nigricans TaxID=341454 RepID=A0A4S2MHY8_9PEZI|nr:hypothetical protein EX30DRAFT_367433 [Ascodesmis nigricans]